MVASSDFLKYLLEVLNLFGYNTNLLSIYIGTIKKCGNYVQVKVKISEFSPLLLLSLELSHIYQPVMVKFTVEILQNVGAFSKDMNFTIK